MAARTSSAPHTARADFSRPASGTAQALFSLMESDWMFWAILGVAAALRLLLLGIKPPHFDEGINGWFVDQLIKNGYYRYDPTNYHGPLHFYILFLSETLFGRNLWALRLPVVLASIGSVWLTMRYDRVLPRSVARIAALAMAISPGFVFYGRYSIHEVWLLLFSMMFTLGLLGLWKHGTVEYLWYTGIGVAGMILTKETYIIHLGCALLAIPVAAISIRLAPVEDSEPAQQSWTWLDLAVICLTGIGAVVLFYSGTFFHWSGMKGLYQTYHAWFETGKNGNGHEKPFYYWLLLVARYEWPVCAGLALCACCQVFRTISIRYLAITGVGVFAAYSIVHYKTPWCIISIVWPLLFIFGAFVLLLRREMWSLGSVLASVLLAVSLVFSIALNYFRCSTFTDFNWNRGKSAITNVAEFFSSEPYVYVQTYNDIYKLTTPLLTLAHRNPVYYHLTGHIIRASPYPLPWILGDFPRVGYYEADVYPPALDADFLLVQEDKVQAVESKLHDSYFVQPLTIRPYQDTSKLYLRASVFKAFCRGETPVTFGTKT